MTYSLNNHGRSSAIIIHGKFYKSLKNSLNAVNICVLGYDSPGNNSLQPMWNLKVQWLAGLWFYLVMFKYMEIISSWIYTERKVHCNTLFLPRELLLCIMQIEVKSEVTQSCLTLQDPMDGMVYQAPLSMGFSRQEYWSGLPFPSPMQ